VKISLVLLLLTLTSACSYTPSELKSPCVATDSSDPKTPCIKRPANAWLG